MLHLNYVSRKTVQSLRGNTIYEIIDLIALNVLTNDLIRQFAADSKVLYLCIPDDVGRMLNLALYMFYHMVIA